MRARYKGQQVGDERRAAGAAASDHYSDNAMVEGDAARTIRRLFVNGGDVDAYVRAMPSQGWSKTRIQCVLSAAMLGVKV